MEGVKPSVLSPGCSWEESSPITSPSTRLRVWVEEEGVGAGADMDTVSVGAATTELGEGSSWSMGTDTPLIAGLDDGADKTEVTSSLASSTAKDPKASAVGSAAGELGGTVGGPAEKLCG